MKDVLRGALIVVGVLLGLALLLAAGNLLLGLLGVIAAAIFAILPILGTLLAIAIAIAILWAIGKSFGCFAKGWKGDVERNETNKEAVEWKDRSQESNT